MAFCVVLFIVLNVTFVIPALQQKAEVIGLHNGAQGPFTPIIVTEIVMESHPETLHAISFTG